MQRRMQIYEFVGKLPCLLVIFMLFICLLYLPKGLFVSIEINNGYCFETILGNEPNFLI